MRTIVYLAEDGWRWYSLATNGKVVSESGEAYDDKSYAITAAKNYGPQNAVIFTTTDPGARALLGIKLAKKINPNAELVIDES